MSRRGFTLIELLVVITIMILLMGLLLPATSIIRQLVNKSATTAVMRQVDTGLRLFRADWSTYPGQLGYPTLTAGTGFSNRLSYQIGCDIAPADRDAVMQDAEAASFAFDETNPSSPLLFTYPTITGEPRSDWNNSYKKAYAAFINRMAREQARMAMIGGNLWLRGPAVSTHSGVLEYDRTSSRVLPVASQASADRPGWACDYLDGQLDPRFVEGEQILDAWRRPLIYICQLVPGLIGSEGRPFEHEVSIYNVRRYGMGPIGFDPGTGPGPDLAATRPQLLYGGRVPLIGDAGDGRPAPSHASWYPDTDRPLHSDRRYYAAPGYATEFELWSSGRDGRFDYMRDAAANDDNLSMEPYDRELR